MNKKQLIAVWIIMSALITFTKSYAKDFQYEYTPFTKEQIYPIRAEDNGVAKDYFVVGTITFRYTTEKNNPNPDKEDTAEMIALSEKLQLDLVDNFHVIKSEPIDPVYTVPPAEEGGFTFTIAKYYRQTAVCNALRLKREK